MKLNATKFLFALLFLGFLLSRCSNEYVPDPIRGETLAASQCTSCHGLPQAGSLPKIIWEQHVLPQKGHLLGFYENANRDTLLKETPNAEYPEQTVISAEEWADLQAYYLTNAPQTLPPSPTKVVVPELPLFQVLLAPVKMTPPSTSLVQISRKGGFFVADANTESLYKFDETYEVDREAKTGGMVTDLDEFATTLGLTVSNTNTQKGLLLGLPLERTRPPTVLIRDLQMPLQSLTGNFSKQQNNQFVIAESDTWSGQLSIWSVQDGQYQPRVLKKAAGAIRAISRDLNSDGLLDIICLFGANTQGVFAFYNQGDGTFREENLLSFEVGFGSTYFNLQDLDQDNDLDLVISNGAPGNYPPILQANHGIRYYTNDGNNQFTESFFYPLNGAQKVLPADYDQDGDLDIAVIAYYPDFQNHPEQSFIFLENQGNGQLTARTFAEVQSGRWLTMDTGDLDLDGDLDLILGSFAQKIQPAVGLYEQWLEKGIPFVVLENQLK